MSEMQNQYQQNLISAIEQLSQSYIHKAQNDLTIEAKILDIDDPGLNSYKVEYMGNKFKAYATNQTVTYSVDDKVYVLIPNGDFTKIKVILSAIQPSATMYSAADNTGDSYLDKSDNLFGQKIDVELCSYKTELDRDIIFSDSNFDKKILESYFDKYSTLSFSCRVRTNLPRDQRVKGNYGLVLRLPQIITKGGTTTQSFKDYIIDINNMLGNPYDFKNWTTQKFYIDIDKKTYDYSKTPQLYAFVKDFTQSTDEKPNDIFINDISLKVCDRLSDAQKTGYYLSIAAEEGELFLEDQYQESKKLTPILKINGKDTSVNSYDCYWFEEDSSVDEFSEYYLARGGRGWKCVNARVDESINEDGSTTFQYETRNYTHIIYKKDIITSTRYKCVIVYGDNLLSSIITIKNLDTTAKIELVTSTGFYNYVKDVGRVRLINRVYYEGVTDVSNPSGMITYDWARYNKEGSRMPDDFFTVEYINKKVEIDSKTYYESEISFNTSLIEEANTFTCTSRLTTIIDDKPKSKILGTGNVTITVGEGYEYLATIQNGDIIYKYDSDGDSPAAANYDGSESSIVKSIKPLEYRVFRADGTELTDNEYNFCRVIWSIPKNSMIEIDKDITIDLGEESDQNYWHVTGFGKVQVPYSISPRFNASKMDNNVLLKIEFDTATITASENIKFLKEGASGTNGTKYTAVIEHDGYGLAERDGNGRIRKFHALYVENDGWKIFDVDSQKLLDFDSVENLRTFTISVYRDGEKIQSFDTSKVEWAMFDENFTNPCFSVTNGVLNKLIDWTDSEQVYCNILQAKVNVSEGQSEIEADEYIYAYYPIEISYLSAGAVWTEGDVTAAAAIPTMQGGFYSVVYASDGTNPQFDSTYDFECYDGTLTSDSEVEFGYSWEVSDSISKHFKANGNKCSTRPNDKYDNAESKNYIKVIFELAQQSQKDAAAMVETRQNEKAELLEEKALYESFQEALTNLAAKYNKNKWYKQIDEVYDLLMVRLDYIKMANSVEEKTQKFFDFCERYKGDMSAIRYSEFCSPLINSVQDNRTKIFNYGNDTTNLYTLLGNSFTVNEFLETDLSDLKLSLDINLYTTFILMYQDILRELEGFNILKKKVNEDWTDVYAPLQVKYFDLRESLRTFAVGEEINLLSNDYHFGEMSVLLESYESLFSDEEEYLVTNSQIKVFILKECAKLLDTYLESGPEDNLEQGGSVKIDIFQETIDEINIHLLKCETEIDYYTNLQKTYNNNIIHIRPIVITLNRYGMASINGWDGNKIYTGSNNQGDYLYAPQIGAGKKEEDNSFTGMIMGLRKREAVANEIDVGLFGYNRGEQTIFLNSKDGSATFGVAGSGQIILKPGGVNSSAVIYGGNYVEGESGLLIDLTAPSIKFGSGNFEVTPEGYLTAKAGGSLAGWNIGENTLSSKDGKMVLDSERQIIYTGEHDQLTSLKSGFYFGENGFSVGSIMRVTDMAMYLGNLSNDKKWTFTYTNNDAYMSYNTNGIAEVENLVDKSVYVGTNGISLGKYFKVSNKGVMYLGNLNGEHWRMSANKEDNKAYIFYGPQDETPRLNAGNDTVYIGTDGISLGMYFKATRDGVLKIGHLTGKHWRISANTDNSEAYIFYGKADLTPQLLAAKDTVYIGTDGISLGKRFKVDSDGNILAGNLESTENKYWIITASGYEDNNESYIAYGTNSFNTSTREGKDSVYIGTDGISLGENKFWVDSYGSLYSVDAYIGGWTIDNRRIHSINPSDINEDKRYAYDDKSNQIVVFPGIKIDADGAIQGGYFNENLKLIDDFRDKNGKYFTKNNEVIYKVYKDSSLSATEKVGFWEITEKGYATFTTGNIAGWEIEADRLEGTNMTIYSKGAMKGGSSHNWSIDEDGTATFDYLKANVGGELGGWTIASTGLKAKSGSMYINSDSSIGGTKWNITSAGVATFEDINVKGGKMSWKGGLGFQVDEDGFIIAPGGYLGDYKNGTGTSYWVIDSTGLVSNDRQTKLSTDGTMTFSTADGGKSIFGNMSIVINGYDSIDLTSESDIFLVSSEVELTATTFDVHVPLSNFLINGKSLATLLEENLQAAKDYADKNDDVGDCNCSDTSGGTTT